MIRVIIIDTEAAAEIPAGIENDESEDEDDEDDAEDME